MAGVRGGPTFLTKEGAHLFPGRPASVAELCHDPEDAAGRRLALGYDVDRAGNERAPMAAEADGQLWVWQRQLVSVRLASAKAQGARLTARLPTRGWVVGPRVNVRRPCFLLCGGVTVMSYGQSVLV